MRVINKSSAKFAMGGENIRPMAMAMTRTQAMPWVREEVREGVMAFRYKRTSPVGGSG
jgi:hypothetical protein